MADISQLVISVDSKGVVTATGNLELLNKSGKKTEKTTETLDQSVKKLTKQFERQARNAGKSANEIKILDLKAKGATDAQLKAAQAAMKNAEAMKQQADAARFASMSAGETNGAFRAMRGSTQQLSWQLQDVAVQAQMGTDAFMILGQQGPQIASIFGSGGAVLGAVIAFGSILGGLLFKAITGTGEAMKRLDAEMNDLNNSFDSLGNEAKRLQRALAIKEIEENNVQIAKLQKEYDNLTNTVGASIESFENYVDHSKSAQEKTDDLRSKILGLERSNEKLSEQTDDLTDATSDLLDNLEEELTTLGMTNVELVKYKASMSGATDEQIKLAISTQTNIDKEKERLEKIDDLNEANNKLKEEQESYNASLHHQLSLLSLSGSELDAYKASVKGGTVEQQKANAALEEKIRLKKEEIKADLKAKKDQEAADKKAAVDKQRAESAALKRGDEAQKLMQDIELANMTELEVLKAHLTTKGGLLLEFLQEDHITLDQYLAMDAELQETYRQAEELANQESNKKKLADAKAYADAKNQLDQQLLSSASALTGQLAGIAEEGSTEAKILFGIQKAIAIATTVINAEVAAAKALATIPPPANVGYANAIRAMGYASAGIIAGTAIAGGRALGGQVRGGESYLVGERGPELLTMGTSGRVTSNDSLKNAITNNSASDVVINQNINVTTGVQSTVRAEIITLMPQIAQAAKGAVADARLRGGNFSKAMSGA